MILRICATRSVDKLLFYNSIAYIKVLVLMKGHLCKLCLKTHLLASSFAHCNANILIRNIWVKHKSWRSTTINKKTLWIRHTYVVSVFIHAFLGPNDCSYMLCRMVHASISVPRICVQYCRVPALVDGIILRAETI